MSSPGIPSVFQSFPENIRSDLLRLREMIFEVQAETPEAGEIEESLKWGQPSYATRPKTGTPLRLAATKSGGFGLFVHCQSRVIPELETTFPGEFELDGNRGVLFSPGDVLPEDKLKIMIARALTYHVPESAGK